MDSSPLFNFRTDSKLYEEGTNQLELRTWENIRVTELKKEITEVAGEDRERDESESSTFTVIQGSMSEEWKMNVHQCRGYIEGPKSTEYSNGMYAIAQGIDSYSVILLKKFIHNYKMYYYPIELIYNVFEDFVKKVDTSLN